MSDETDIELAKLKYADAQAKRDFWKWVVMGIGLALQPLVPIITSLIEQRVSTANAARVVAKVEAVGEKAEVAAGKAEVAAVKADENIKTGLRTNIALNQWKASYTNDPMDAQHAAEAERKLEAHETVPASVGNGQAKQIHP